MTSGQAVVWKEAANAACFGRHYTYLHCSHGPTPPYPTPAPLKRRNGDNFSQAVAQRCFTLANACAAVAEIQRYAISGGGVYRLHAPTQFTCPFHQQTRLV